MIFGNNFKKYNNNSSNFIITLQTNKKFNFLDYFSNSTKISLNNLNYLKKNKLNNLSFINNKYNFLRTHFGIYNLSSEERINHKFVLNLIERSVDFLLIKKLNYFYNYKNNKVDNFLYNIINDNKITMKRKYFKNIILNIKNFIIKITGFNIEKLNFFTKKQILNFCIKKKFFLKNFEFFFSLIFRKFFYDFIIYNYTIFFFHRLDNFFFESSFFLLKKFKKEIISIDSNFFKRRYIFLLNNYNFFIKSQRVDSLKIFNNVYILNNLNFKNLIFLKKKSTVDLQNASNKYLEKLKNFYYKFDNRLNFFFNLTLENFYKNFLFFSFYFKTNFLNTIYVKNVFLFNKINKSIFFINDIYRKKKKIYSKRKFFQYNNKFFNHYFLKINQFYIYNFNLSISDSFLNNNNFFFQNYFLNNEFLFQSYNFYKIKNNFFFISLNFIINKNFKILNIFNFLKKNSNILRERIKVQDMNPKTYYKKFFLKEKYKDLISTYYNLLPYFKKRKFFLKYIKILNQCQKFFDIFFSKNLNFKINERFLKKNEMYLYIKLFFRNFMYNFSLNNRMFTPHYLFANSFLINFFNNYSKQYFNILRFNRFFYKDRRYYKIFKFFIKSILFSVNKIQKNFLNFLLFQKTPLLSKINLNKYFNKRLIHQNFFYIFKTSLINNLLNILKYKKNFNNCFVTFLSCDFYKNFFYFRNIKKNSKLFPIRLRYFFLLSRIFILNKKKENIFIFHNFLKLTLNICFFYHLKFFIFFNTFNYKYIFKLNNNKLLLSNIYIFHNFKNFFFDLLIFEKKEKINKYNNIFNFFSNKFNNFINNLNFKFFDKFVNFFFNNNISDMNLLKKMKFNFLFVKKLLFCFLQINYFKNFVFKILKNKIFFIDFKNYNQNLKKNFIDFKRKFLTYNNKLNLIFKINKRKFGYNIGIYLRFLFFKIFVFRFYVSSYYNILQKFLYFVNINIFNNNDKNLDFFFFGINQYENFLIPFNFFKQINKNKKNLLWLNINITKRNVYVNLFYNRKKPSLFVYTAGQTRFEGKLKKSKEASILIGKRLWKRIVFISKNFFSQNIYFYKKLKILNNLYLPNYLNTLNKFFIFNKIFKNYLINFKKLFFEKKKKKKKLLNILTKSKFILFNKVNSVAFFKNSKNYLMKNFKIVNKTFLKKLIFKLKFKYNFSYLQKLNNFFFLKILYFMVNLDKFFVFTNKTLYNNKNIYTYNISLLKKKNLKKKKVKNNKFLKIRKIIFRKKKKKFKNKKQKLIFFRKRNRKNLKLFLFKIFRKHIIINMNNIKFLFKNLIFTKKILFSSFFKKMKKFFIKLSKIQFKKMKNLSTFIQNDSIRIKSKEDLKHASNDFEFLFFKFITVKLKYLLNSKFFLLTSSFFLNKRLKFINFNLLKTRNLKILFYKKYKIKYFLSFFQIFYKKIYFNNRKFSSFILNPYLNFKYLKKLDYINYLNSEKIEFVNKFNFFIKCLRSQKQYINIINTKNLFNNIIYLKYFDFIFFKNNFLIRKKLNYNNFTFLKKMKFHNYFLFNKIKSLNFKKKKKKKLIFFKKKNYYNSIFFRTYTNSLLRKINLFWRKFIVSYFLKVKFKSSKKVLKFIKLYRIFSFFLNQLSFLNTNFSKNSFILFKNLKLKGKRIKFKFYYNNNKYKYYNNNKYKKYKKKRKKEKSKRINNLFFYNFKIIEQIFFSNIFYKFITLSFGKNIIIYKRYFILLNFFKELKFIWLNFLKKNNFYPIFYKKRNYLNKSFIYSKYKNFSSLKLNFSKVFKFKISRKKNNKRKFYFLYTNLFCNKIIFLKNYFKSLNFKKKKSIFNLKFLKLLFVLLKRQKIFENKKYYFLTDSFSILSKNIFKINFKKYIHKINLYKKIYFFLSKVKILNLFFNFLKFINIFFNKIFINGIFKPLITKKKFKNILSIKFFMFLNKLLLKLFLPQSIFFFNKNRYKKSKLLFFQKYLFINKINSNIFRNYFFFKQSLFFNFLKFDTINFNIFEPYKNIINFRKFIFKNKYKVLNNNFIFFKFFKLLKKSIFKIKFFLKLNVMFFFIKFYKYFSKISLIKKRFLLVSNFNLNNKNYNKFLLNLKKLKNFIKLKLIKEKIKNLIINSDILTKFDLIKVKLSFLKFELKKKNKSFTFFNKSLFVQYKISNNFKIKNKKIYLKNLLTLHFFKKYTIIFFKKINFINNNFIFNYLMNIKKKKKEKILLDKNVLNIIIILRIVFLFLKKVIYYC
jgi:hypothetical protein